MPVAIRETFEQIQGQPEPIIERFHRTSSSIHDAFRGIAPIPPVTTQPVSSNGGAQSATTEPIVAAEDDVRPILRLAHIPRNHFAETFFNKGYIQWIKNLA